MMLSRFYQFTMFGVLLVSLAACTQGDSKVRSPHWDQDGCARCRMAVSEPAAAAQLVAASGLTRHYDDLGCLIEDLNARPELAQSVAYVLRPGSTTEWVRAEQVHFAAGGRTPMGFGFLASNEGELSFADVRARVGGSEPPKHSAD